jgi:hypothetical protein
MKGLPRSIARGNKARKDVHTARINVEKSISFTGSTGVARWGSAQLDGLPEGNILLLGAVSNLTFTGPGSTNLKDDWEGDYAVGTTATADATLSTTEANLIASTAIPASTSEKSANVRATNATQAIIDNTDGTAGIVLNMAVDADEVTNETTVAIAVTGTVDVAYIVLGDD